MVPRSKQTLLASLSMLGLIGLSRAQITSNATCLSSFSYLFNAEGQSPCLVAAYLGGACNGGQYDVSALNPGEHYIGPAGVFLDPCQCSTVMYSMMGACSACQNATIITWTAWDAACSNVYVGVFPQDIPAGTGVPAWAYSNVTSSNIFTPQIAVGNTASESTATNQQTTQTAAGGASPTGGSSSSSSSSGKKSSSNTGAIAGGVVGGVVFLALVGLLAFFLIRRNKKNSSGVRVSDTNSSPLMMDQKGDPYHNGGLATPLSAPYGTPYSPPPGISPYPQESFAQKPYNPDDPSTFPTSPAPPTMNSQYTGGNVSYSGSMPMPQHPPQGAYSGAPEI
ncbi:hypothetical protein SCHPADRAFT_906630 [Schizopora paradoxa]|uniref:Epidermal growth factor receptor-like transmembrane-juxtamembrane segment domain-containing protein n=1 Tax=Schizopora paradoxa TaxID=27342 RepID=A0A0H2RMR5_9AGAM|nr:hypothetical protein SCHPADRAFT_906630 [Schizopora paradoxa]